MTLNDDVVSAIEKTLLSSPVSYPYLETITKIFWLLPVCRAGSKKMIFVENPLEDSPFA